MPTITYRRRSSVLRAALVATVLTAVTAVGHGTSRARADGGDTARAEAIGAALEATVGAGDLANETFSAPGEALVARDGQTVVEIPLDPADGVDVAAPNGVVVGIGLPGGEFADSAQVTSE
jgi:hypothetical protein